MLQNTIRLGNTFDGDKVSLHWRNSNGILIAGIPGSGKSQSAALYLTQYAYSGTKIVLCDYNAALGTGETLLDRVTHLEPAFILPAATTKDKIVEYIGFIKQLGDNRYSGADIDHYPIIFVIDEFPAFLMDYEPEQRITTRIEGDKRSDEGEVKTTIKAIGFIEELVSSILKFRKVNIHYMLIGQEWAQMGTAGVRPLRSNMTDRVLHRMDESQALLFGITDSATRRQMQHFKTGQALYNDTPIQVPLLTDNHIRQVQEKIGYKPNVPAALYKATSDIWTPEDTSFYESMHRKYWPQIQQRYDDAFESGMATAFRSVELETMEDLVLLLLKLGKSTDWIRSMLKGRNESIVSMIKNVKSKYDLSD